MSKLILAAGVAALAMTAPAAAQQHGGGHGKGSGNQGQAQAKSHGGPAKEHGPPDAKQRGNAPHASMAKANRDQAKARGNDRSVNKPKAIARADHANRDVARQTKSVERHDGSVFPRLAGDGDHGLVNGCPPGLAMKSDGCMPPGQAKKVGQSLAAAARAQALAGPYSQWYRDNDRYMYRMSDGVLYEVNRSSGLIDALIPYGMRDYSYYPVGYTYPSLYNSYNLPYAYRSYYPDGSDTLYRYGGNAIYAVDPQTNLVSSIVSLLAGDLAVGQPLPPAYSVYNVPLAYRTQYADTANDWYRYNDGYIYRVDPTTQLVTAVINALT